MGWIGAGGCEVLNRDFRRVGLLAVSKLPGVWNAYTSGIQVERFGNLLQVVSAYFEGI